MHDRGGMPPEQAQSVEEARARRERLAKMRSLLFHQEAKLKHLAKIKSKDFHRRAKRAAQAKARMPSLIGASLAASIGGWLFFPWMDKRLLSWGSMHGQRSWSQSRAV